MQALTVAWLSASPARQAETLALARLREDELNHALTHPLLFALQPHRVVDALAGGLGFALEPPAWPELSAADRNALMIAAEEAAWTVRRTLRLQDAARLELARGGTRRLSFATPRDWYDFDQRTP